MSRVFGVAVLTLSLALSLLAQSPGTQASKKPEVSSASAAKIIESKIRQLWQDFKERKKDAYAAGLTDDNTAVWADGKGIRDKAAAVKDMDSFALDSYSLSNFKITPLGTNAAMATYGAKVVGAVDGQKLNLNLAVTEVWVKRGGHWKELRYHESEIK
jgi:hypothetical protein